MTYQSTYKERTLLETNAMLFVSCFTFFIAPLYFLFRTSGEKIYTEFYLQEGLMAEETARKEPEESERMQVISIDSF